MGPRCFDVTPDAPRKVRAFVLTWLATAGCGADTLEAAMLCASELATASLDHGGGRLEVTVWGRGVIHVEVSDDAPATSAPDGDDDLWRRAILGSLTEEWGEDAADDGTTRWFDIAC